MSPDSSPRGGFALSDEEFGSYRDLIRHALGFHVEPGQRALLAEQIRMRAGELGREPADYYEFLSTGAHRQDEMRLFTERLVVNETYFFRTMTQIEALKRILLPEIIAKKKGDGEGAGAIRLWSAGCSTGEEPYTLAFLLSEIPAASSLKIQILGTDVSGRALDVARRGVYGARSVSHVPPGDVDRYFERAGDGFRVRTEHRRWIEFREMNLLEPVYPRPFDLILFRNVMIYFPVPERTRILQQFFDVLYPDSSLLIGYSENLRDYPEYFRPRPLGGVTVYTKWTMDKRHRKKEWAVGGERRIPMAKSFEIQPCRQVGTDEWILPLSGIIDVGIHGEEIGRFRDMLLASIPFSMLVRKSVIIDAVNLQYINNHGLHVLREICHLGMKMKVGVRINFPEKLRDRILGDPFREFEYRHVTPLRESSPALRVSPPSSGASSTPPVSQPSPPVDRPPRVSSSRPRNAVSPSSTNLKSPGDRKLTTGSEAFRTRSPISTNEAPPPSFAPARSSSPAPETPFRRFSLKGEWPDDATERMRRLLKEWISSSPASMEIDASGLEFIDEEPLEELARFLRLFAGDGGELRIHGSHATFRRKLARLLGLPSARLEEVFRD